MKRIFLFISMSLFLFLSVETKAQEHEHDPQHENKEAHVGQEAHAEQEAHHGMKGAHRFSVGIGHAHVSQGKINGKNEWLVAPTWAIDYDYWISDRWAIGLQNEILVESFPIEDSKDELIERNYPVSVIPSVIWKPFKRLSFVAGVGLEFAEGHNLTTVRLGLEYGFHLPNDFEISAAIVRDDKINYYNSFGLSLTVSKIFRRKHH